MTFHCSTLVTVFTPLLLTACSSSSTPLQLEQVEPKELALLKGNYIATTADDKFTRKGILPKSNLREISKALPEQTAINEITGTHSVAKDQIRINFVSCQFNKTPVAVYTVFNAKRQVSRLFFQTAQDNSNPNISFNSPTYVQQKAIQTKWNSESISIRNHETTYCPGLINQNRVWGRTSYE